MGQDANRYIWLREYFLSSRQDLDDEIVACVTPDDLDYLIDKEIFKDGN